MMVVQVVEQTHDEKIAMYMKSTKRELVEMLINCNEIIARRAKSHPRISVARNGELPQLRHSGVPKISAGWTRQHDKQQSKWRHDDRSISFAQAGLRRPRAGVKGRWAVRGATKRA